MFQHSSFRLPVSKILSTGALIFFTLAPFTTCVLAQDDSKHESGTSNASNAQDQTVEEFRKYATEKLPSSLSKAKIDLIVKRVDKNGDGIISESEYESRVKIFRDVARGPEPWIEDLEEARALAKEQNKPLLIYGRADWCAPCQRFEKDTLPLDSVQNGLTGFILFRLDIDADKDATRELGINAIPVMIIETPEGELLGKSQGAKPEAKLIEWLTESISESEAQGKASSLEPDRECD